MVFQMETPYIQPGKNVNCKAFLSIIRPTIAYRLEIFIEGTEQSNFTRYYMVPY
jgi:hypothetical protein